jgi:hypothetical protein
MAIGEAIFVENTKVMQLITNIMMQLTALFNMIMACTTCWSTRSASGCSRSGTMENEQRHWNMLLFFGGHMFAHLAGWEELALFLIGLIALGVEVFVIPGFGVAGVIGIASGVNHKCLLGDGIAKDGAVALERANRKGFDHRLGNCGLSHVGFRLQGVCVWRHDPVALLEGTPWQ